MEIDFTKTMSGRTNAELIEIVTKLKDAYQPEAVKAAELEIIKRNLSAAQVNAAKEETAVKDQYILEKERIPLSSVQRILFFIFFWGVIPWGMAATFKADGYLQKHRDAWKFMKYGLFAFIGVNALMVLIVLLSL
jgi:hypothetical protein